MTVPDRSADRPASQRLRTQTRASHEHLDRQFSAMLENLDYDAYRRFVRVSHACHGAVERALTGTALAGMISDWPERSRLPSLERDMAAMTLQPITVPSFDVEPGDLPGAFGAGYVLEGSRLGARYIHRRFTEGGASLRWPGASFGFIEADPERRFKDFTEILDRLTFDEAQQQACVVGADRAFAFFAAAVAEEQCHSNDPASAS